MLRLINKSTNNFDKFAEPWLPPNTNILILSSIFLILKWVLLNLFTSSRTGNPVKISFLLYFVLKIFVFLKLINILSGKKEKKLFTWPITEFC